MDLLDSEDLEVCLVILLERVVLAASNDMVTVR